MKIPTLLTAAFFATALCGSVQAQDEDHMKADSPFASFIEPEFPFFCQAIDASDEEIPWRKNNIVPRGVVLNLGEGLYACFDTDLLRTALIWRETEDGEFLSMTSMSAGSYRVPSLKAPAGQKALCQPIGDVLDGTGLYPGWWVDEPMMKDPREPGPDPEEVGRGPIPAEKGKFLGIFRSDSGTVLHYRVGDAEIADKWMTLQPRGGGEAVPQRRVWIGPHEETLVWIKGRAEGGTAPDQMKHPEDAVSWSEKDGMAVATIKASSQPIVIEINGRNFEDDFRDPADYQGASPIWLDPVKVPGFLAASEEEAYVIDEVPLPLPNPWKRNVRLSAMDFFSDGSAAVVTFDGDVWKVTGLGGDLEQVTWKRFASGLHEPMGMGIVDDVVYVFDRNGIIVPEDVNGDGEADYYRTFSNVVPQTAETREFAMGLLEKPGGGFYLAKGGQVGSTVGKENGTVVEVSADGQSYKRIAHGLRQPFVGIDPKSGLITASDQQGNWVPSTPIHVIEDGKHYGFLPETGSQDQTEPITEPLCWIPHFVNQSGAGQVWLRDAQMGPLNDSLIHIGYNRPELFKVYIDDAGGVRQGGVANVITNFPAATLHGQVNPRDGQLYVCGFKIWGTVVEQLSGLFRVRYTGKPSHVPEDVRSSDRGILMRFSHPLDPEIATNPQTYTVDRWNYQRSKNYGSGNFKLDGEPGQESLPVASVLLSEDKQAVFLGIPDMQVVHQIRVTYRLPVISERPIIQGACLTVHQLNPIDLNAEGFATDSVDLTLKAGAGAPMAEPDPSVEEGKKVYQMFGCMACHTIGGEMPAALAAVPGVQVGPSWEGLYGSKREFADGTIIKAVDDVYLRESILDPASKVAKGFEELGEGMPSYLGVLKDYQIESVILYIKSLAKEKSGGSGKKKKEKG